MMPSMILVMTYLDAANLYYWCHLRIFYACSYLILLISPLHTNFTCGLLETDDSDIKIADFGFAKKTLDLLPTETACGTPGYVCMYVCTYVCMSCSCRCSVCAKVNVFSSLVSTLLVSFISKKSSKFMLEMTN